MHADSIHFADSLKCKTLKKQRIVYGGGGIMPDYFIPLDTLKYSKYYQNLSRKNCISENYMDYQDKHRKELKETYKDFKTFRNTYNAPAELIDSIFATGTRLKVTPANEEEKTRAVKEISLIIKALTARDIWDMSEYFAIVNEDSESVQKALEILTKNNKKKK